MCNQSRISQLLLFKASKLSNYCVSLYDAWVLFVYFSSLPIFFPLSYPTIFLFPFFLSNFPLNAHICLSFTKNNPSASWLSSYLRSLHSLSPLPYQGSCTALSVQCALCTASRTRRTGSSPSPSTRTAVLVLLPLLCWISVTGVKWGHRIHGIN